MFKEISSNELVMHLCGAWPGFINKTSIYQPITMSKKLHARLPFGSYHLQPHMFSFEIGNLSRALLWIYWEFFY